MLLQLEFTDTGKNINMTPKREISLLLLYIFRKTTEADKAYCEVYQNNSPKSGYVNVVVSTLKKQLGLRKPDPIEEVFRLLFEHSNLTEEQLRSALDPDIARDIPYIIQPEQEVSSPQPVEAVDTEENIPEILPDEWKREVLPEVLVVKRGGEIFRKNITTKRADVILCLFAIKDASKARQLYNHLNRYKGNTYFDRVIREMKIVLGLPSVDLSTPEGINQFFEVLLGDSNFSGILLEYATGQEVDKDELKQVLQFKQEPFYIGENGVLFVRTKGGSSLKITETMALVILA